MKLKEIENSKLDLSHNNSFKFFSYNKTNNNIEKI